MWVCVHHYPAGALWARLPVICFLGISSVDYTRTIISSKTLHIVKVLSLSERCFVLYNMNHCNSSHTPAPIVIGVYTPVETATLLWQRQNVYYICSVLFDTAMLSISMHIYHI